MAYLLAIVIRVLSSCLYIKLDRMFHSRRSGQYNDCDVATLNVEKKLMTDDQIKAWHTAGMVMGAHSRSHPRLPKCTDEELQTELAGSKADLDERVANNWQAV